MSLRVRLFLLLGGLVILLVAAEWWLVRSLTQSLSAEMGRVAVHVGHSVATVLSVDEERVGENELHEMTEDVHIVPRNIVEHDHALSIATTNPGRKPVYIFKRKVQTTDESGVVVTEAQTELQKIRIHLVAPDKDSQAAGYVHLEGDHLEESRRPIHETD